MNLRQIETFAAVMSCGSASRAAEVLGVTQPAVSRTIVEFERAVGFSLFARISNRLVATPEARLLYNDVQAAFHGIDKIRAAAARIRDHGSGEIKVASLSSLGQSVVSMAVGLFRKRRPDTRITYLVLPSRDVRDLVASGQYDVGIAADEIDTTGVASQVFMSCASLCAMPKGHPLSAKKVITPRDLDGVPLVAYLPEDRSRQRLDKLLEEVGANPQIVVETIYGATALALVSEGIGVTLISEPSIGGCDRSKIVFRPFEPLVQVRSLLILPSDRPKSQLVRDFIDALVDARDNYNVPLMNARHKV